MNVFLWIVQALLAALFLMSGLAKVAQPKDKLTEQYPWMQNFSQAAVRFIGAVELLGAIGLIAPAATGIAPILTPLAATGLAIVMALAAALHIREKESRGIVVSVVLFVLAALIAWGRFGPYGW